MLETYFMYFFAMCAVIICTCFTIMIIAVTWMMICMARE